MTDDTYFSSTHVTVIQATKWRSLDFKELWAYRELLWVLTERDIKVRYKQTVLGVAWAVLQPLASMVIFSIFFGHLAKMPSDGLPYPIFVYAALLPWIFFSNAISNSANSLVGSTNLVSKVYFPRLIIPLAAVGAWLIDFFIAGLILLVMMLIYGIGWTANLLFVPVLLLAVIFTALGIGTFLSALTVAYRDFRYIIPFMVQLWLFATPVVYPASLVPAQWQWALYLNPMAGLIEGFRASFLGLPFNFTALSISLTVSVVFFVLGILYFERVERRFADII